jgi:hypothetical protein
MAALVIVGPGVAMDDADAHPPADHCASVHLNVTRCPACR